MRRKRKNVYVGMSGGVDSSVAASLLKKAGFDVVGVYLKCWTQGPYCASKEDERSARLAASHLDIPLYVWNFLDEYKEKVVDYMLSGYEKGITPNPDIMCNREIKFGLFFEKAMKLGADYVATGHYARLWRGNIMKARDTNKDQSYFLSMIDPAVRGRVLFPIGDFQKAEVRAYAQKIGLPNAGRKDSQGICFVGKVEIGDFLRMHIPQSKGTILSTRGRVLGEHDGAWYYTIGQRQGMGLAGGPWYVAGKDVRDNTLTVTKEETEVMRKELLVKDVNWFSEPQEGERVSAKFRYRQEDVPVSLEKLSDGSVKVIPETLQRAITPGQFAVFYQGDKLLGGGVILPQMV